MITFDYPFDSSPSSSVTIKNPQIGDSISYDYGKKVSHSMDATRYIYRKTSTILSFALNFTDLTRTQALALKAFLETTKGEWIKYTDYNSVEWKVKVLNPFIEINTYGKGGEGEGNSINIEVEGTQIV